MTTPWPTPTMRSTWKPKPTPERPHAELLPMGTYVVTNRFMMRDGLDRYIDGVRVRCIYSAGSIVLYFECSRFLELFEET